MEYLIPLNRALEYFENGLTQTISIQETATAVGYSRSRFGCLFRATIGETPGEYIRKRRLSEAARELVTSKKRILDIALDYQFESQEAFTRSFKRMFHLSPAAYRQKRRLVRTFPRIILSYPLSHHIIVAESKVVTLGQTTNQILSAHIYAVSAYRNPTSLLRRRFDDLYLLVG
jgi:AraC-like DNA-binding protein